MVHRGPWRAAALVAALVVAPLPCRGAPDAAVSPTKEYEQGIAERDAGNFVAAAEHFDVAYRELPAEDREVRAAVLFDLIEARRNAFAEGEGAPQICEAERLLVAFLDEVKAAFGARGDKRPDTRKARRLLGEVRQQITVLRRENSGLDCAREVIERPAAVAPASDPAGPTAEAAPGPAQGVPKDTSTERRARTFVIAGAATTGAGGLFLALMAAGLIVGDRAERDGSSLTTLALIAGEPLSRGDPELQAIVRRGRVGNGLAIGGGILATAAITAGVALLVLGSRSRPPSRAAFAPSLGPGFAGGSLSLRF